MKDSEISDRLLEASKDVIITQQFKEVLQEAAKRIQYEYPQTAKPPCESYLKQGKGSYLKQGKDSTWWWVKDFPADGDHNYIQATIREATPLEVCTYLLREALGDLDPTNPVSQIASDWLKGYQQSPVSFPLITLKQIKFNK